MHFRQQPNPNSHSPNGPFGPLLPFLLLLATTILNPQPAAAQTKDTCRVGMYLISLYDLDFPNESFTSDLWIWFLYRNDSLKPLETVEVAESKKHEFLLPDSEKKGEFNWATMKCKATIRQAWNIDDFPFDTQVLKLTLESADADTSDLTYVADSGNSALDSAVELSGWVIKSFTVKPGVRTYRTTYGDPELKSTSSYATVIGTIVLKRIGVPLFLKSFTGVYVAFLIAIMGFFVGPGELDPRLGLSVGALFATVGNKYIVDGILPDTTTFTLVDSIHMVTFLVILITVVLAVIAYGMMKRGKIDQARRFDRWSSVVLCGLYLFFNVYAVYATAS
jgi:hypothetical protein